MHINAHVCTPFVLVCVCGSVVSFLSLSGISFSQSHTSQLKACLCFHPQVRTVETSVMVASGQKNLLEERMKICRQLWDADIKVGFLC